MKAKTDKQEREQMVREALALSTLDAPSPDEETLTLARNYIDGQITAEELQKQTIARFRKG